MCWQMLPYKVEQLLSTASDFIAAKWVSLEETQKIAGRVNHLAQMMPFLWAIRWQQNDLLGEFGEDKEILLQVKPDLTADLKFCANAAISALQWLPIAAESTHRQEMPGSLSPMPPPSWEAVSPRWVSLNQKRASGSCPGISVFSSR
jgi:hypothetical protein